MDTRPATASVTGFASRASLASPGRGPGSPSWRLSWWCSRSVLFPRSHSLAPSSPRGTSWAVTTLTPITGPPTARSSHRSSGYPRRGPAIQGAAILQSGAWYLPAALVSAVWPYTIHVAAVVAAVTRRVGAGRCVPVDAPADGRFLDLCLRRCCLVLRRRVLRQCRACRHRSRLRVAAVGVAGAVLPVAVELAGGRPRLAAIVFWQATTAMYPGQVIALTYVARRLGRLLAVGGSSAAAGVPRAPGRHRRRSLSCSALLGSCPTTSSAQAA